MSLIKQLWLAIAVVMTLAFGGAFLVSTLAARHYLQQQLYVKNVDNAASLALSMSQMAKDPVTVELQLSAQFDAGHYRAIRLTDPEGRVIVERHSEAESAGVPRWFADLVPLAAAPGVAQVQDGWKQFGTLTLESHDRYAYAELWQGTLRLLGWFLLAALVTGVVGTLLLRVILRPLREVVAQAEAIGGRRFVTTAEPSTSEFRTVVRAMNALSGRVRSMVEEESRRVDELRRQAQQDLLTGLLNRGALLNAVEAALAEEQGPNPGALVILRVAGLAELNRDLGREATDTLLARIGVRLRACCEGRPGWVAGRLNGADFAVLTGPESEPQTAARSLAGELHLAIDPPDGAREFALPVGAARPLAGESVSSLLARVDRALAAAQAGDGLVVDEGGGAPAAGEPTDLAGWRGLLEWALASGGIELGSYPVVSRGGDLLHEEAPARLRLDDRLLPAGRFVAWAARLGMMPRLDLLVVEAALARIAVEGRPVGVNVSPEAMCDGEFHAALAARFRREPRAAAQLWLEVPEYGALRHKAEFRAFCQALRPFGCRLGLEHAGPQFARIGELHDVGLDYLKIESSIVRDIDGNPGNQVFLRGMCMVAHAIGLTAIAEGVRSEEERRCLPELGVDGMTGPAIAP